MVTNLCRTFLGLVLGFAFVLLALHGIARSDAHAANELAQYYSVPVQNLKLVEPGSRPSVIDTHGDLALVTLNPKQLEELSKRLHETQNICGGMMAVIPDETSKGVQALTASTISRQFHNMAAAGVAAKNSSNLIQSFTLTDPRYPQQVSKVLPYLSQTHFLSYLNDLANTGGRNSKNQTGVAATNYVKNEVQKIIAQTGRTNITVRNVPTSSIYIMDSLVVKFAGSDSTLPAIVIGGHLDTINVSGASAQPGADDDATGAATVLEVLSALAHGPYNFNRDIYFIFYSAEEYGLVGSQKVVQDFTSRNISVMAVMQLDMTGYKSSKDAQEMYFVTDYTDSGFNNYLKKLAQTYTGLAASQITNMTCGYACSDHVSWTQAGISSAVPFEGSDGNYNPNMHSANDVVSILDPNHAMYFVKLAAAFAVEAGEPIGLTGSSNGNENAYGNNSSGAGRFPSSAFASRGTSGCGLVSSGVSGVSERQLFLTFLILGVPFLFVSFLKLRLDRRRQTLGFIVLTFFVLSFQNCTHQKSSSSLVPRKLDSK